MRVYEVNSDFQNYDLGSVEISSAASDAFAIALVCEMQHSLCAICEQAAPIMPLVINESCNMPIDLMPKDVIIQLDPRDHFLASYSPFDRTAELEDGSLWKINMFDMYKLRSWASNDVLKISPNNFAIDSTYRITNQTTGESIRADLYVGPIAFGPNTHWIVGIDLAGSVYLEDGSVWDARWLDRDCLFNWALNDTVILGDGGNEWLGQHNAILINVNMNQYVYANRG